MNVKYQVVKQLLKLIPLKKLPQNAWGDKVWSLKRFIQVHKRLPTKLPIYNDVLFNIKTSDEILNPLRVFTTDKEFVKLFVKAVIGEQYNVPTLAVLHSMEDVHVYNFPTNCCIKPTHASGEVIFCNEDNTQINMNTIQEWFNLNYSFLSREQNYKLLKPKVIVEPLIFNSENPSDYKIFCFNGKPKMIQINLNRYSNHSRNFYDIHWNEMRFSMLPLKKAENVKKPENLNELLDISEKLSRYFSSLVRIDLYTNEKDILVGEITHCSENALSIFSPVEAEMDASKLIFSE